MKKRAISVLLTAAMTAGMLAGCGGGSQTAETKAPTTAAEKTAGTEAEGAQNAGEFSYPCLLYTSRCV